MLLDAILLCVPVNSFLTSKPVQPAFLYTEGPTEEHREKGFSFLFSKITRQFERGEGCPSYLSSSSLSPSSFFQQKPPLLLCFRGMPQSLLRTAVTVCTQH